MHELSVHIETSGGSKLYSDEELEAFNIERDEVSYCMDIKCPGSEMAEHNVLENIPMLAEKDELKFVVKDEADLEFSLGII